MKNKVTAEQIDALLPQTQCGLCSYNGCMPYATALARNEAEINLCPPGGVNGLFALGKLLNIDPAPYVPYMQKIAKPNLVAVIREAECIGCTKCITACPVDAILGGPKQMHSIITNDCTGCELCVAPCPVDCIDMIEIPEETDAQIKKQKSDYYRQRYHAHQIRTENKETVNQTISDKQAYIQAALLRVKNKL